MNKLAAASLAAAVASCAHAPPADPAATLAEAERAFAAHSVREDMRAAFLAHFAPDGVFVRGAWVPAAAWLAPRPAPPIVLDWRPVHVEVAGSADLGLSTGPWRMSRREAPGAPPAYGQFVSIWKREAGGPWKVAADIGISHPQAALWEAPLAARSVPAAADAGDGAAAAEARFARLALDKGAGAALEATAAQDVRVYREGHAPGMGPAAARALAASPAGRLAWQAERVEVARSGDLAYALGSYGAPGAGRAAGHYLRVWRREAGGWRVALDIVNALP